MSKRAYFDSSTLSRTKKFDTYSGRRKQYGPISDFKTAKPVAIPKVMQSESVRTSAQQPAQTPAHKPVKQPIKIQSDIIAPAIKPRPRNVEEKSVRPVSSPRQRKSIASQAVAESVYELGSDIPIEASLPYVGSQHKKGGLGRRVFLVFGTFVFIAATAMSAQTLLLSRQAKQQTDVLSASQETSTDAQGVAQGTGDQPAESKPDDTAFFSYQVEPEEPRYLRLPERSTYARVKQLGTTAAGAVDAPWNVHDVGWYNGSIKPGSKAGVSLLLGHVSGYSTPGVFAELKNMTVGETVEVEKGDGTIVGYEVKKIEEYAVDDIDMRKILYEVEQGVHSLRLMTCSGIYDAERDTYLSRTVVYADQVY